MWYIITWLFLWGFCYLIYKGQKEKQVKRVTEFISKLTNTKKYIIERKVRDYVNNDHWL